MAVGMPVRTGMSELAPESEDCLLGSNSLWNPIPFSWCGRGQIPACHLFGN